MTNGEKHRTVKEREIAHKNWCAENGCGEADGNCSLCAFLWLDLKTEEEQPMNCPFCGDECVCSGGYLECLNDNCCYSSGNRKRSDAEAIAAHNRICKAVSEYKKNHE